MDFSNFVVIGFICLFVGGIVVNYYGGQITKLKEQVEQFENKRRVAELRAQQAEERARAHEKALKVNGVLFNWMDDFSVQFRAAEAKVGHLPDTEEFFGTMSPKMREELQFTLGPVFAEGTAQLTSQQIEAIGAFQEICQRLLIYLKTVDMEAAALTVGLRGELEIAHRLLQIFREWDEKLDDPAMKPIADILMGKAVTRLVNESKLMGGLINPATIVKTFLAARVERARLDGEKEKQPIWIDEGGEGTMQAVVDELLKNLEQSPAKPQEQPSLNGHKKG